MALFDYKCEECNHVWEELKHPSQTIFCPKCKSNNVKKLLSKVGGFILRGSGFYKQSYNK